MVHQKDTTKGTIKGTIKDTMKDTTKGTIKDTMKDINKDTNKDISKDIIKRKFTSEIENELKNEIKKLEAMEKKAKGNWKTKDEKNENGASLRVAKKGKHYDYYLYRKGGRLHSQGLYIKKSDLAMAKRLAQSDYEARVLATIENQKAVMEKFLKSYDPSAVRKIYENLHPGRQVLVKTIEPTDEEFVNAWLAQEYEHKEISISEDYLTERGERVRSKSEMLIANKLYMEGIPYLYEKPIKLKKYGDAHVDFTVLNVRTRKEYYWEHCGQMDNPGYYANFVNRHNAYLRSGYLPGESLLETFESKDNVIDMKNVEQMIEFYLR